MTQSSHNYQPGDPAEPRELVGRMVRQIWVEWAQQQPNPKPSWLLPWDELDTGQREVDMRIGAALFSAGQRAESHTLARIAALGLPECITPNVWAGIAHCLMGPPPDDEWI